MMYDAIVWVKDEDTRYGVLAYADKILHLPFNRGGITQTQGDVVDYYPYEYVAMDNQCIMYQEGGIGYGGLYVENRDNPSDEDILKALDKQCNYLNEHICEKYRTKNKTINCGFNKEMFKLIMHMNDETDYNTPFVERGNPHRADNIFINTQWKDFEKDCNIEWCKKYMRKATIEDIIELGVR